MTLSAAQYSAIIIPRAYLIKDGINFEQVKDLLISARNEERKCHGGYERCFTDRSLKSVMICVHYLLSSVNLPWLPVTTRIKSVYWTIKDGNLCLEKRVSHQRHVITGSQEIETQSISKDAFENSREYFKITSDSSIQTSKFPSQHFHGSKIVDFFKEIVLTTSPHIQDLTSAEWRFENLKCYGPVAIAFALEELREFAVEIKLPYSCMGDSHDLRPIHPFGRSKTVNPVQALCVRIPAEAFLNDEAVAVNHDFSVRNVVALWRQGQSGRTVPINVMTPSADEVLAKISEELAQVAIEDPVVKRYAFNVEMLDHDGKQALLNRMHELGYEAVLDTPFIYKPNAQHTQYMFINLP